MYILDTDAIVHYLRGDADMVRLVPSLGKVYATVASIAELSYGMHNSNNPKKHAQKLLEFIKSTDLLGVGLPTSLIFGQIKSHLRKIGKPIDDFDVLIASSCLVHDCKLVTRNKKHYENIPGLKLFDF